MSGASSNTNLIPNAQIVFGYAATNWLLTLTANPNLSGQSTISVVATGPCGATNQTNFSLVVTNFPPQISAISNQVISYNTTAGPLAFNIFDVETPADSLVLTASSSNTNLLPLSQIVLGGSGTNCTVALTPNSNLLGVATITLSVTDALGATTQTTFMLTVTNHPPQISAISNQVISYNTTAGPLAFTIFDVETPADSLVLTASSSNTNLLPLSQILLGGSGTNRTVTLTPNTNLLGVATITLSVADALGATNQTTFTLTVMDYSPQISFIPTQNAPLNAIVGPLAFTVSETGTPAGQLVVTPASSNNNIVSTNQIILGGSGANRTVTIVPGTNAPGTATVTLKVTDELGVSASRSFSVTLAQFTQIAPGLPQLAYGAVAWGDYDNDGQLDLLVSGSSNGSASGALTRIYHNDGGLFTNYISLTNLYNGAVAWADYDRDGRLDAVVSGLNSAGIPVTQLYHNNGDGTFTPVNAGLAAVYNGTLAWGDFDNDGAADLYLSGLAIVSSNGVNAVTNNLAKLYHNNGDGTFTDMNANLPGLNSGTAAWGDFDNDGRQDLLLVGLTNNTYNSDIASIYRNLGGGVFTNVFFDLLSYSAVGGGAWGDYNSDGWLDFVICGPYPGPSIFRNNGNGTFTAVGALNGPNTPSVAWGDYNNDGYLDLVVGGSSTVLYRNNGGNSFTSTGITLPAIQYGSVAWADDNHDGNLDLFFPGNSANGTSTTIYRNNNFTTNTPPTAPTNLAATTAPTNMVFFTWSASTDAQTPSNGLSYNLRVGTTPGGVDVVSPLADPTNGTRRVVALGNVGPATRAWLLNLPPATYYWSVQAIDTAFAGGPFAPDGAFTTTNARPIISTIPNQVVSPLTQSAPITFTIGDVETSASNLVLAASTSNPNIVALTNIVFGGAGSNRTVQVTPGTNGVAAITVTVSDAQGAYASASFTVTATAFSLLSSNFVPVQNSFVAWGDYNNDGRLDVLMAGNTNGNAYSPPVTQLYRNDGNGVLTPVASGLPGVTYGAAAWGDFNNDGYLDLILTGTTNGQPSGAIARIYSNNGDGTFTDIGAGLPGVYFSAVAWGDFDNDGRLDLLLTGTTNGNISGAISRIYHNNGDGTFSNTAALWGIYQGSVACADFEGNGGLDLVLAGFGQNSWIYRNNGNGTFTPLTYLNNVYHCSVAVGDFDNNGRPDVLLAGYNGSSYLTSVYHNNGGFGFFTFGASLPGAAYGSAVWGDFDNDGRLDILLTGTGNGSASGSFTSIYHNTGSPTLSQSFSLYPATLPTNYLGTATCADCENDGNLDLLLTGTDGVMVGSYLRSQTMLFHNNSGVANTPPTAPTALSATRSNAVVLLSWAKSTDAQTTNANGLTYQIRVGATPGGIEIESPGSDPATGYRRIVQAGHASTNKWRLANLPPGTYYWSVQAIDTAFAGSPFATESTFTVLPPPVANPDTISTGANMPVTFNATNLTLNDIDPNGYPLTVTAVSSNSTMHGTVALAAGMVTYTPSNNFAGNDTFTYMISDGQSAPATGTVLAAVGTGGMLSLKLVSSPAMANGNFVVWLAGIPGLTYTVETSSTLNGPWAKVGNVTAPTTNQGFGVGAFQLSEPVTGNTMQFYRLNYPPY